MKYRNKKVKEVDTIALLFEIIKREGTGEAPIKTTYFTNFEECIVGIGKDNIASIYLDEDDIQALNHLMAEYES